MIKLFLLFSIISLIGIGIHLYADCVRYNKQLEIYDRQIAECDRELARLRLEYLLINSTEAREDYCSQEILIYSSPV